MIGPILRRARKGNSRRIIMEARLPHFSHNPRPAPFSAAPRNTNPIPGRFFVRLTTCVIVCGAYAVASYLNGKNLAFFSFTRPLPWSSVGRMQYAPTRVPEKMAIFFCTG